MSGSKAHVIERVVSFGIIWYGRYHQCVVRVCHVPAVDPKLIPPPVLLLPKFKLPPVVLLLLGAPNPPKVVVLPAVVPPNAAGAAAGAAVVDAPPNENVVDGAGAPPANGPGDVPKLNATEKSSNTRKEGN